HPRRSADHVGGSESRRSAGQYVPLVHRHSPRAAKKLHERRAPLGKRRLLRGRDVLLPPRGHQNPGGTTMAISEPRRLLPLIVYLGGLVLVFLGERVFSTIGAARMTLSGAGFALVVGYLIMRLKSNGGSQERRRMDQLLALFALLSVVALVIAFLTTD